MLAFTTDMGIDLGTATILVFLRGKGIVLNESSVVAIEQQSKKVLAVGESARKMLGRTPGNIIAICPLREGVIADFDITEIMLRHYIAKVGEKRRFFRPRVVVCIPAGTTTVEQKAVIEAVGRIGAKETYLIEEPRAAALGAGMNIFEPSGSMVVDIGGGTTDVAVLSMGEIVVSSSVRAGGNKFDEAIIRFIKNEYNILIGERTAEALKIQIGAALPNSRSLEMEVRGRDLVMGLPRSVMIKTEEVVEAVEENLFNIVQTIKQVLEKTPPELAGDIIDKGIIMTGGGSLLHGLDRLIAEETGVPVFLAEKPIESVAIGTGKALEHIDQLSHTLISTRKIVASI
ncbi:MAG: rod shape-determining protein [Dethiobacteria bacterium]